MKSKDLGGAIKFDDDDLYDDVEDALRDHDYLNLGGVSSDETQGGIL